MHVVLRTLRNQWLGVVGIVVGVSGVALGATGQPALLGKLNQADRPTTFQNTGSGPAATFKSKGTEPPFIVASTVRVPKLNASKLGGKPSSAFAARGASYTKPQSDARYAPANGSASYLAAGSLTLAVTPATSSILDNTVSLYDETLRFPEDGTITITAFGTCYAQAIAGRLRVEAGSAFEETPVNAGSAFCEATVSLAGTRGTPIVLKANVMAVDGDLNQEGITDGIAVVTFVPAE